MWENSFMIKKNHQKFKFKKMLKIENDDDDLLSRIYSLQKRFQFKESFLCVKKYGSHKHE